MAQKELTRREMYDLVWSMPMTKAAAELEISDVGLKKICDRHRVPTPPRGYWAKKDAGQKVKQTRFHETANFQDELIVIRGISDDLPEAVKAVRSQEREARKSRPTPLLALPPTESVTDVHKAAAATARALRKHKPDKNGAVSAHGQGLCGITVSEIHVERAIHLLDGLARRLEMRGLSLTPAGGRMAVNSGKDALELTLTERVEMQKHQPTVEELAAEDRRQKKREREMQLGRWSYDNEKAYPEFDAVRTGELCFAIKEDYVRGGLQRNWRDGKRQTLEAMLDDIASGVVTYLAGVKAKREEHEAWHRNYEREQRRRQLAQRRKERDDKRLEFAKSILAIHREIGDLRAVLDAVQPGELGAAESNLLRLVDWTEERIGSLQQRLNRPRLNERLQELKLFPERDDLVDEVEDAEDIADTDAGDDEYEEELVE